MIDWAKWLPDGYEPGPLITVPFAATNASIQVMAGRELLCGFSVIETTGASSAQVDVIDGNSNGGNLIKPIALSVSQSFDFIIPDGGLLVQVGLWLAVNVGTVRGTAWVRNIYQK